MIIYVNNINKNNTNDTIKRKKVTIDTDTASNNKKQKKCILEC